MWQYFQYQAYSDAVRYYDPKLRDTIGTETLLEALKEQAAYSEP